MLNLPVFFFSQGLIENPINLRVLRKNSWTRLHSSVNLSMLDLSSLSRCNMYSDRFKINDCIGKQNRHQSTSIKANVSPWLWNDRDPQSELWNLAFLPQRRQTHSAIYSTAFYYPSVRIGFIGGFTWLTKSKSLLYLVSIREGQCEVGVHWAELQKISVTRKPVTNSKASVTMA